MQRIIEEIRLKKIMISDGAWGTFLQEKGLSAGECPESWNLTHRSEVLDIARRYIEAGADMIETNSFGANRLKLAHYGLADKTAEINEAAASISREAAGPDRHVIASIGPTGRILMMGDTTEQELYEAFAEQARALEAGGADACCIETMSALDEALAAVRAVKETTGLEIIATFTFEKKTAHFFTMMGVTPGAMAEALIAAGADIIGTNCGNGMERMVEIVKEIREVDRNIPVLVHANAGLPEVVEGGVRFPETPEMMAAFVPALIEAGANVIGGCCGTTPEHITAIRRQASRFM